MSASAGTAAPLCSRACGAGSFQAAFGEDAFCLADAVGTAFLWEEGSCRGPAAPWREAAGFGRAGAAALPAQDAVPAGEQARQNGI